MHVRGSGMRFIRIPTRFKTPAFRPERAPPRPEVPGLRGRSGGDANSSTPQSTGLKAGDKLVVQKGSVRWGAAS